MGYAVVGHQRRVAPICCLFLFYLLIDASFLTPYTKSRYHATPLHRPTLQGSLQQQDEKHALVFNPNYSSRRNHLSFSQLGAAGKNDEKQPNNNTTKPSTAKAAGTPNPPSATAFIEGIGGKGGLVYDVNRLKRNLLQETMTAYKEELFELLSQSTLPTDDAQVVEKLLALVQASPIRTTTDSNLLDGEDNWVLAYRSQYPMTVASLVLQDNDPSRASANGSNQQVVYNARYNFLWSAATSSSSVSSKKKKRLLQRSNVFVNKLQEFFQTKQRTFRLEDLEDDEDAYVMDTTFILGGLLTKTKVYALTGLTRSSLSLQPESTSWSLLGRSPLQAHHNQERLQAATNQRSGQHPPLKSSSVMNKNINNKYNNNKNDKGNSFSVQIIYLDNDLCILTEEDGPDSPFMVYTRNRAYLDIYKSMKRKLNLLKGAMESLVLVPFRKITGNKNKNNNNKYTYSNNTSSSRRSRRRRRGSGTASVDDPILKEIIQNDSRNKKNGSSSAKSSSSTAAAKLRVLRLGDINGEEEDESWESESDPFVHLSADERQRLLKAMSVEEVEQAADTYRNSKNRFRFFRKLNIFGRRKTYFKKPPEKWRSPKK